MPDVERRTALFVDFDNIYSGLKALDEAAAEAFATYPARWLDWLAAGHGAEAPDDRRTRRLLVRSVYLNPKRFGNYRAIFTRSGFRSIDCPPLTTKEKNSADIYMVIDILDSLTGGPEYDEYVIMSADSDFTPILQRLRAYDRRTTVVAAGLSAASYRANCDVFVTPERLAAAALGEQPDDDTDKSAPALAIPPSDQARAAASARAGTTAQSAGRLDEVTDAIRRAVREASAPVVSAAAAQAALGVDPVIKEADWYGAGSFRAFLALYLPDLVYVSDPPGWVLDPARHDAADLARPDRGELEPLLHQVCTVTGAPELPSVSYRALFIALAAELRAHEFALGASSKRVRDSTDLAGTPVPRNAIAYVMKGLVFAGHHLSSAMTARDLSLAWSRNVLTLCDNAQMTLSDGQRREIEEWLIVDDGEG